MTVRTVLNSTNPSDPAGPRRHEIHLGTQLVTKVIELPGERPTLTCAPTICNAMTSGGTERKLRRDDLDERGLERVGANRRVERDEAPTLVTATCTR